MGLLEDPQEKQVEKVKAKRGFEKAEKIALVRKWLIDGHLGYDSSLSEMVEGFMAGKRTAKAKIKAKENAAGKARTKGSKNSMEAGKSSEEAKSKLMDEDMHDRPDKRDDLADCVVQAVTYAMWEENKSAIRRYDEEVTGDKRRAS